MIGSYRKAPQAPLPNRTCLFDTCIDSPSLTRVERYRPLSHQTSLELNPPTVRRQHWRSICPMTLVDRTPIIAMQPRTIAAEGQEISDWNMLVVEINVIELHLLSVLARRYRSGFCNMLKQSAVRALVVCARAMTASARNTNTQPASGTASPTSTPATRRRPRDLILVAKRRPRPNPAQSVTSPSTPPSSSS